MGGAAGGDSSRFGVILCTDSSNEFHSETLTIKPDSLGAQML